MTPRVSCKGNLQHTQLVLEVQYGEILLCPYFSVIVNVGASLLSPTAGASVTNTAASRGFHQTLTEQLPCSSVNSLWKGKKQLPEDGGFVFPAREEVTSCLEACALANRPSELMASNCGSNRFSFTYH